MADLLIRGLDPQVLKALQRKADEEGLSVEELARRAVRTVTLSPKERFIEAALASQERTRRERKGPPSDSTEIIRRYRDAD